MKKIVIRTLAIIIIPVLCIYFLQLVLVPKHIEEIQEGSMIGEYYKSQKNHDVLILGDCEVYENISTVKMWEQYGIVSYIRGSAEQLIWQSYYLLEDTLKYETPKVVVLNVLAMTEAEAKTEAYNRMTLDEMKWSMSKFNSIKESMTQEETMMSYVFPIMRYHSRWSDVKGEDFKYMFSKPKVTTNGYLMQVGVRPVTTVPPAQKLSNYEFSEKTKEYLNKTFELCKNNNIQLVLMKAPSVYPYWYDEWDDQINKFAKDNNIMYINTIKEVDKIGIDYNTDTFDHGQHLNVDGAEKFSSYLGNILTTVFNVPDRRNDSTVSEYWNECTNRYNQEKERKLKEWKEENEKK